jgi:hypothetical protein
MTAGAAFAGTRAGARPQFRGSAMRRPRIEKRTGQFHWETRQQLYDYFSDNFGLPKAKVDTVIEAAMKEFRVRQGQAIQTKELWQKVGKTLQKLMVRRSGP